MPEPRQVDLFAWISVILVKDLMVKLTHMNITHDVSVKNDQGYKY